MLQICRYRSRSPAPFCRWYWGAVRSACRARPRRCRSGNHSPRCRKSQRGSRGSLRRSSHRYRMWNRRVTSSSRHRGSTRRSRQSRRRSRPDTLPRRTAHPHSLVSWCILLPPNRRRSDRSSRRRRPPHRRTETRKARHTHDAVGKPFDPFRLSLKRAQARTPACPSYQLCVRAGTRFRTDLFRTTSPHTRRACSSALREALARYGHQNCLYLIQ